MSRFFISILCLTLIYAFTLGSFHPWDLLMGVLISGSLYLFFRRYLFDDLAEPAPPWLRRMVALMPFIGAVAGDITRGTWQVMLIALHLRPLKRAGLIAVPIEERTPAGVAVTALVTTLSPGAVLIDVDWQRQVMLFHVTDASDPEAVRAKFNHFYRRYQRRVFP
ncbi:MAG: Na+/H+ antiporter subunit E [Anaerolineaceae bacterium]|nr:Na+/H+ antiporter subunit E [Anaerolineaceae bacterium]